MTVPAIDRKLVALSCSVAAVVAAATAWRMMRKRSSAPLDTGVVAQLWIYPVKSCGGIQVQSWPITPSGLKYDREWVIIRLSDSSVLSLRDCSKLKQIRPSIDSESGVLTLHFPDGDVFRVPTQTVGSVGNADVIHVSKSGITGGYARVGDSALDAKLSDFTGTPVALARCSLPRRNPHHTDKYQDARLEAVSSALQGQDFSSVHVCTEAGLQWVQETTGVENDLNLMAYRFRTNIVFRVGGGATPSNKGPEPKVVALTEDNWDTFRAGVIPFYASKRCARCPITTLSQQGEAHPQSEPLQTLGTQHMIPLWRGGPLKPIFGLNAFPMDSGIIAVGDPLTVLSLKPESPK